MPNIEQYSVSPAQVALRPSDLGTSAAEMAGRRIETYDRQIGEDFGRTISQVGSQIGQAVERHQTQAEISHGGSAFAQGWNDLTTQWNTLAQRSDPNDTSVAQGFTEKVFDPWAEKFVDAFNTDGGRQWAEERVNSLRMHFADKMSADMSTRAGDALVQNTANVAQQTMGMVHADPTALPDALKYIDDYWNGLTTYHHGNLTADQVSKYSIAVDKIKSEVAKAAIQGMAETNPDEALKDLHSGQFDKYLGGDIPQLENYIRAQQRLKVEQARSDLVEKTRAENQASVDAAKNYMSQLKIGDDGHGTVPQGWFQQIAKDPRVKPSEMAALIQFGRGVQKDVVTSEPGLLHSMMERVMKPAGDSERLTLDEIATHVGKDLSNGDADFLRSWMKPPTPQNEYDHSLITQTVNEARSKLAQKDIMTGGRDPVGEEAMSRFETYFYRALQKATAPADQGGLGLTVNQALDKDGKDYILKDRPIESFGLQGDDLIAALQKYKAVYSTQPTQGGNTSATKPSLDDIFSGKK